MSVYSDRGLHVTKDRKEKAEMAFDAVVDMQPYYPDDEKVYGAKDISLIPLPEELKALKKTDPETFEREYEQYKQKLKSQVLTNSERHMLKEIYGTVMTKVFAGDIGWNRDNGDDVYSLMIQELNSSFHANYGGSAAWTHDKDKKERYDLLRNKLKQAFHQVERELGFKQIFSNKPVKITFNPKPRP